MIKSSTEVKARVKERDVHMAKAKDVEATPLVQMAGQCVAASVTARNTSGRSVLAASHTLWQRFQFKPALLEI